MVNNDNIRILIATWLEGDHLEDLRIMRDEEFGEFAPLVAEIRRGNTDPATLSEKSGVPLGDIGRMLSYAQYETMYEIAMNSILQERFKWWLADNPGAQVEEIINEAKKYLRDYNRNLPNPVTVSAASVDYLEELDRRKNKQMLPTGIKPLDETICGIRSGNLVTVSARPSVGKSAFLLQVGVNVAKAGGRVLFFPLEMTLNENIERMVLRYTDNIPQKCLKEGVLTKEQWDVVGETLNKFAELEDKFLMFKSARSIEKVEALIKKYKPDLVIIDQAQQMISEKNRFGSIRERFIHMTSNLKNISIECDTSVWLASQQNRTAEDSGASLARIKESGSFEEDSDVVILLDKSEEEETIQSNVVSFDVAKNRHGPRTYFELEYQPEKFVFWDAA